MSLPRFPANYQSLGDRNGAGLPRVGVETPRVLDWIEYARNIRFTSVRNDIKASPGDWGRGREWVFSVYLATLGMFGVWVALEECGHRYGRNRGLGRSKMFARLMRMLTTETLNGFQHPDVVEVIFQKTLSYAPQVEWSEIAGASTVLDFGGGCGRHYKEALLTTPNVRWAVVEIPAMVGRAKELETDKLRFFTNIRAAADWLVSIDVMHSNGAIQYTPASDQHRQRTLRVIPPVVSFGIAISKLQRQPGNSDFSTCRPWPRQDSGSFAMRMSPPNTAASRRLILLPRIPPIASMSVATTGSGLVVLLNDDRPAAPLPAAHCSLTSDVQVKPNRGRAAGVMRKAVAEPKRTAALFLICCSSCRTKVARIGKWYSSGRTLGRSAQVAPPPRFDRVCIVCAGG